MNTLKVILQNFQQRGTEHSDFLLKKSDFLNSQSSRFKVIMLSLKEIGHSLKVSQLVLLFMISMFSNSLIQAQSAICDPAFSEGTGDFNNAICLPQSDAEASSNRGYLLSCDDDPVICPVAAAPSGTPVIPTFSGCPDEVVEYTVVESSPDVFTSLWNNGISTIGASAGFADFASIGASNQGFINQLFCELDAAGLPTAPASVGTPLSGSYPLITNGAHTTAFATANGETNSGLETELVQSDFWVSVPDYVTDIGFSISGGAADGALFMVGTDINNMCAVAEAFCLTGGCINVLQGVTQGYYSIPASAAPSSIVA